MLCISETKLIKICIQFFDLFLNQNFHTFYLNYIYPIFFINKIYDNALQKNNLMFVRMIDIMHYMDNKYVEQTEKQKNYTLKHFY